MSTEANRLENDLSPMTLVLLPGLDGTGDLFANFVSALPPNLEARIVRYPTHLLLSYSELFSFVSDAIPRTLPFVLLAESFSTPLAVMLAATDPSGLRGLIICAGFIKSPVPDWLLHMKGFVQPALFRVPPPRFALEHFLIGACAPRELRDQLRRTLRSVSPEVVASRVRAVMECDAREEFVHVRVPTLYLQAEQDRLVKNSSFEEIQRLKPDTALASIPAPHFVLQREPRKAADLIAHFVEGLPG
jgi:pimeloyl-ACP methyl ester carboxylesterase